MNQTVVIEIHYTLQKYYTKYYTNYFYNIYIYICTYSRYDKTVGLIRRIQKENAYEIAAIDFWNYTR